MLDNTASAVISGPSGVIKLFTAGERCQSESQFFFPIGAFRCVGHESRGWEEFVSSNALRKRKSWNTSLARFERNSAIPVLKVSHGRAHTVELRRLILHCMHHKIPLVKKHVKLEIGIKSQFCVMAWFELLSSQRPRSAMYTM